MAVKQAADSLGNLNIRNLKNPISSSWLSLITETAGSWSQQAIELVQMGDSCLPSMKPTEKPSLSLSEAVGASVNRHVVSFLGTSLSEHSTLCSVLKPVALCKWVNDNDDSGNNNNKHTECTV